MNLTRETMRNRLLKSAIDSVEAVKQLTQPHAIDFMELAAELISKSLRSDGKVLVAGNGGSLCDAMHFAEELTGYFRQKRPALPAIALADPAHLTCVGNDAGFETVFSRSVEALGRAGDVLILLTTSGNSPNIQLAVEAAKQGGLKTIAFLGKGGGKLKGSCDLELIIEGFPTSDRIQEAHMAAMHMIIEVVECHLFSPSLAGV